MTHALDVIRSVLINLLVIGAILAVLYVLVMAWRAGRRRQLVVAEWLNSTGHSNLDGATRGLTQLARQSIDSELRFVGEGREKLYKALRGTGRRGRRRRLASRVQHRLDNNLNELLAATREVAPQQAQPAVQLITMLVSRPRGLLVSGILQYRAGPRWGVSFDVLRVDTNRSLASETFWGEPTALAPASGDTEQGQPDSQPADVSMIHERILDLLAPAARWVAIQLVMQSTFPRGARGREKGLDRLISGALYAQSAEDFPDFDGIFRRLALQDLRDAAAALKEVPRDLAALADSLDLLATDAAEAAAAAGAAAEAAKAAGTSAADIYELAHKQYARALHALGAMPSPSTVAAEGVADAVAEIFELAHKHYDRALRALGAMPSPSTVKDRQSPPEDPLVQRIRVRQATSWLDSELEDPLRDAYSWLNKGGPVITPQMPVDDSYDAAKLYTLAAELDSDPDQAREWRQRAAQLLDRDPKLWARAERDDFPVEKLQKALASNAQPPAS